ncbi:MAG: NmrA family NAD(P)-binding protein [Oscillospiraceae bacterium]|nr:NmrA family NAD(P)-binding protein [Oscillospiraceae bacterium]
MKKILLCGVDGNFGSRAANTLLEKWPHEDLIFTAPTEKGLEPWRGRGAELRAADFNDGEGLVRAFSGADTMILISMPFVGPKRRAAHQKALDAAVKAGVHRVVYTSIVGAGEDDIDAYEVNDHVWFEAYVKSRPIHYLFMRNSQYAEAMVSSYVNAYETTDSVLANNMGQGRMAYVSRDDCALAAACAAMSDWEDRVVDVNGAELLTIGEYVAIANEVTGRGVRYVEISDEEQYAFFDSIGVPRTTEDMWAQTASNFPFCSDGMVSFGRAIRKGQMAVHTDDFEKLTGRKPLTVREIFEHMDEHLIGSRTSTD